MHDNNQQQQQQQQHESAQQQQEQVQSIITTTTATGLPQTLNLMGLRNVQITEHHAAKTSTPLLSRIKYTRDKIITAQGITTANVQIIEHHESQAQHEHDLSEAGKYEINEIDLNNTSANAAIISDLVKYAEIDDIELPDGTKIGIGFAPSDITEHQLHATHGTTITTAQIGDVVQHHHHHHQQHHQEQQHEELELQHHQHHQHQHHQQLHELQDSTVTDDLQLEEEEEDEHDDATTSVDETILPDNISVHEHSLTKSYTILTSRPLKQEQSLGGGSIGDGLGGAAGGDSTTYELSLSDSSMQHEDTKYICRHCGKKYRWKSTLRRHENVECGGKEPCHPCPHCSYKAKQRGNLGVHVRKHHPDKPQLESKRGRKM